MLLLNSNFLFRILDHLDPGGLRGLRASGNRLARTGLRSNLMEVIGLHTNLEGLLLQEARTALEESALP